MEANFDFIVVGAGLSGIDAGYRLKTQLPNCSYTILEARNRIGGTWSFFKFPGIRSDSQLTLFGFPWRPWPHDKDMPEASLIQSYIEAAARDEGIDQKIQFRHRVTDANWSSEQQQWALSVDVDGTRKVLRATFLLVCSGYYAYDKPLETIIPGIEQFRGVVAHPQFWPESLSYDGKRVIIIGSGATAVTMLPVLAKTAGHVTMLQRSPSYVFSLDAVSPIGKFLRTYLPRWLAEPLNWWRCFAEEQLFRAFCLTFPSAGRKLLLSLMRKQLPASVPIEKHFDPSYPPFDQRLCVCPDGDFFKALHQDNCDVVTDVIDTVTSDGILTKSGQKLEADIIVTATGLHVQILGGMIPTVDGVPVDITNRYTWRGVMLTGVPNAGVAIGYTTSSWTMGCDASIKLIIQVWKHMKKIGATSAMPVFDGDERSTKPVVQHSSTYFVKARDRLPRITGDSTWYGRVSPVWDYWKLWFGSVTKGMKYTVSSKKKKKKND